MEMTKKRIIYTIAVTLIVVFSTSFAILMTLERQDYRNYLQSEYSRNMYELINSVDNIRSSLTKSAVIGTKDQELMVLGDIFRYSTNASDKLSSLPVSPEVSGSTNKFLSQVGDFANSMAKGMNDGKSLTDSDYETIEKLKMQSVDLHSKLNNVMIDINNGRVSWGEIRQKVSGVLGRNTSAMFSQKFQEIQKQVSQYPALVYDGPFSDNVQDIKPRVEGEKEVTREQAVSVVKKAIGPDKIADITDNPSKGKTRLNTYGFIVSLKGRATGKDQITCEVTKNGGKLSYLLDNKIIGKPTIDQKKAQDIGNKFLQNIGYSSLIPTYILNYDNSVIISYVYEQQNILIYPDQIKLKVALDDGRITGVEANKYLISHIDDRIIPNPKITQAEAKGKVGRNLTINNVRLAIVPTDTNKELLCYEFFGTYKKDSFFVYINADSGSEFKVLEIVNTPNGTLTM